MVAARSCGQYLTLLKTPASKHTKKQEQKIVRDLQAHLGTFHPTQFRPEKDPSSLDLSFSTTYILIAHPT